MYEIDVYAVTDNPGILAPLPINRKWMDDLPFEGVYRCFPMGLANQMGYGISFPEDISFEWNGTYDGEKGGIKVYSGHRWIHKHRGWATLAISTGLKFRTPQDVSMLAYPIPNEFYDGFQVYTALLSTSFFKGAWEITLRITEPNKIITIPANTPIGAIMPISLGALNGSTITLKETTQEVLFDFPTMKQIKTVDDNTKHGRGTGLYRKGVDHNGVKYGEHEVSKIDLFYDDALDPQHNKRKINKI